VALVVTDLRKFLEGFQLDRKASPAWVEEQKNQKIHISALWAISHSHKQQTPVPGSLNQQTIHIAQANFTLRTTSCH